MRVECMISLWEKKQKLIHCLFVLLLVVWVFKSCAIYEKGSILTIPSLQFMWKQSLQSFKSQNIESNFYQQRLCSANSSCWHWSKAWYTILFCCASAHHHHHIITIIMRVWQPPLLFIILHLVRSHSSIGEAATSKYCRTYQSCHQMWKTAEMTEINKKIGSSIVDRRLQWEQTKTDAGSNV